MELQKAETYWLSFVQGQCLDEDVIRLKKSQALRRSSPLLTLHPFVDADGLVRVGGREHKSNRA